MANTNINQSVSSILPRLKNTRVEFFGGFVQKQIAFTETDLMEYSVHYIDETESGFIGRIAYQFGQLGYQLPGSDQWEYIAPEFASISEAVSALWESHIERAGEAA